MSATSFQRARSPEHKQQRETAILAAARELALRDGVRAVTLGGIAERVGIHKSALLRYFETREQIFLVLTAEEWRSWQSAVVDGLGGVAEGDRVAVAEVLAGSFADRPLLCDLIPHTALDLERRVSVDAARRYKRVSLGAITEAVGAVHRALPALGVDGCVEVVSTVAALAGAWWQIATPPPALAALYAEDPELAAAACPDLAARLRRTAEVLLAGVSTTGVPTTGVSTTGVPTTPSRRTPAAGSG